MLNSLDAGSHSDISYAADPKMKHGKSTPVVRMIPQSCIPMLQVLSRLIYVDTDFTRNWNKERCPKQIETQYTPDMGMEIDSYRQKIALSSIESEDTGLIYALHKAVPIDGVTQGDEMAWASSHSIQIPKAFIVSCF